MGYAVPKPQSVHIVGEQGVEFLYPRPPSGGTNVSRPSKVCEYCRSVNDQTAKKCEFCGATLPA